MRRLRTRLAFLSLLTVVPTLGLILYTQALERARAQAYAHENAVRVARLAADRQAGVFAGANRFLSSLAQNPAMRSEDRGCADLLSQTLRDRPGYINVIVVRPDGSIACSAAPLHVSPEEMRRRSWFPRVTERRTTCVGDYGLSATDGQPSIAIARPMIGPPGQIERIFVATIRLTELNWVASNAGLPPGATLTLFDRQRKILAHYPDNGRWIGHQIPETVAARTNAADQEVETVGVDGVRRIYTTLPVEADFETGLSVAMGVDHDATFLDTNRLFRKQMWVFILATIAAFALGTVGGDWFISRPIGALTEVTRRLSAGDLTARVDLATGTPGMGELGRAINSMATALEARGRERDAADQQLRASEDRYRQLFERNPQSAWVYDPVSFAFWAVNETAIEQYGFSRNEFLAFTIRDLHPPEDRPALEQHLAQMTERNRSVWRHRTKDGRVLMVDVRAHAIEWDGRPARLALIEDITERKHLEDQLRQAQKMEAIGQLAGGVAHDFNNLLTAIQGYAELLTNSLAHDDARRGDVDEIIRAAQRAAALTRQLLAFSRKQILAPRVLRPGDIVAELTPMLRRIIGETIDLQTVTADHHRIKADANQFEQVLINLVVNARDAMPDGGRLTIETADVSIGQGRAGAHPRMQPGAYVRVAVTDMGHGMDPATQARIFEPFFTTKEMGRGTGLGLSTVYGIVKQSGGYVWVDSVVGRGSTFSVYLPQTDAPAEVLPPAPRATRDYRGTETILLVEDEDVVRDFATKILRRHGYTVHAMPTPADALELARDAATPVNLVLTDMVMPGMNGRTLAGKLLSRYPGAAVMYMSGYTDDAIVSQRVLEPGMRFLQKPFTGEALLREVRDALDLLDVAR